MAELKGRCAVIGGGAMGRQIALNAAINNYDVTVCESFDAARESLAAWKEEYLAGRIAKGKMTEEQVADIKARFAITADLEEACKDADIFEANIEEIRGNYEQALKLHLAGADRWSDDMDFISGARRMRRKGL